MQYGGASESFWVHYSSRCACSSFYQYIRRLKKLFRDGFRIFPGACISYIIISVSLKERDVENSFFWDTLYLLPFNRRRMINAIWRRHRTLHPPTLKLGCNFWARESWILQVYRAVYLICCSCMWRQMLGRAGPETTGSKLCREDRWRFLGHNISESKAQYFYEWWIINILNRDR